jgi:hypothetical protein
MLKAYGHATKEDIGERFATWCARADASGIEALQDFAGTLRHLALAEPGRASVRDLQ